MTSTPTASLTTAAAPMTAEETAKHWHAEFAKGRPLHECFLKAVTTYAAQVRRAQWRDISTAPKDEATSFLVRRRGFVIQVSWFEGQLYPDARESCIDWENGITDATHWMPFPLPPSPVKAGGETP